MPAGRLKLYNSFKLKLGQGIILLNSHTFKLALFLSTSNCHDLSHDELADLTNQHANANGYTTGGVTLTGVTLTDIGGGNIKFDCNDPSFTASGGSIVARSGVIYDDTVAGDPLVGVFYLDATPADVTVPNGSILPIGVNAAGFFSYSGGNVD